MPISLTAGERVLPALMNSIWSTCFHDIPQENTVQCVYLHPWKRRLGLIRMSIDTTTSIIGINTLLQHTEIPDYVIITTIAHEIVHYVHGYGSPRPRKYDYPHANNVVTDELQARGLGTYAILCNEWIETEWFHTYQTLSKEQKIKAPEAILAVHD